jgi:hypothetical protein
MKNGTLAVAAGYTHHLLGKYAYSLGKEVTQAVEAVLVTLQDQPPYFVGVPSRGMTVCTRPLASPWRSGCRITDPAATPPSSRTSSRHLGSRSVARCSWSA